MEGRLALARFFKLLVTECSQGATLVVWLTSGPQWPLVSPSWAKKTCTPPTKDGAALALRHRGGRSPRLWRSLRFHLLPSTALDHEAGSAGEGRH